MNYEDLFVRPTTQTKTTARKFEKLNAKSVQSLFGINFKESPG